MGLLDDVLRGALGGGSSPADPRGGPAPAAAGMGGVVTALLPVVLSMLASRGGGRGGDLADVLGQVLGGGQPGGGGGLADVIGGMTGRGAVPEGGMGGLGGLIQRMQRAGYGDQARSWVSTGPNMPINPGALEEIFGHGHLDEIAQRAGVTREQATQGMAELLPEVVDRVTPDGEGTDFDQLTRSVDDLRHRMGL